MAKSGTAESAWTTKFYPRDGDATGFDRVIFFSDAVFAIAMTLMAVEIGIPEIHDPSSVDELLNGIADKGPHFFAFGVAFAWVAIYWQANHRFTTTLRGMSSRYIVFVLIYLAFVAFLPFPAGLLGQYGGDNPVAVAFFAIFAACVSALEVALLLVAHRDGLFLKPLSKPFLRQSVVGGLLPALVFLLSIPIAFWVSQYVAMVFWLVASIVFGFGVNRLIPASAPT